MPKINWDKLSLEELKEIQQNATKAIDSYQKRMRKEALAAAKEAAAKHGFALDELVRGGAATKTQGKPKYSHPENPAKTWTGRGRQPNWVKEALAGGTTLEDLLLDK